MKIHATVRRYNFFSVSAIVLTVAALTLTLLPFPFSSRTSGLSSISPIRRVEANSTYFNLTGGNLLLNLTAGSAGLITSNNNWSAVPSVEGYCGSGLTATFGVDPQTVLSAEFPSSMLPTTADTCIAANKGNPSAFNAGGLAEFDTGTYLAFGFQGNVQARAPYMVFYLNTTGRTNVGVSFDATDIDGGSNNAVTPVAIQYRVGETGNFTNLPAGYIADATDANVAGRKTSKTLVLPAAADNQPKVQVRIITTDAAGPDGMSTPDEWVGVNNIRIGNLAPTAASVTVSGLALTAAGRGISKASIIMWDEQGNVSRARTNGFGYYTFFGVEAGRTYVFSIASKIYVFTQPVQTLSVDDAVDSLNFTAQ